MLDMNKAYAVLGLNENATEEELEKRYELLLRKKRGRSEEEDRAAGEPTMADITKAYNFIKSAAIEELIKEQEPKSKAAQKISHIWDYYRWHIIGGIVAVLLLMYTLSSIMDNRNEEKRIAMADVKVTFFTNFQIENADLLEVRLLEEYKDWKDVHLAYQFAPTDPKEEYGMAHMQKAMLSIVAEKVDVYILDPVNYEKFGSQGTFQKLDDVQGLSGLPEEMKRRIKMEDGSELWAGIDISGSPLIKELNLPGGPVIAAIGETGDKKENAVRTMQWLAGQGL